MGELVKDLLNILTKEVIRCGDSVETRKMEAYFLANRLIELGYVKVVRCGQCKYQRDCERIIIRSNDVGAEEIDYCSEGEAKEAGE